MPAPTLPPALVAAFPAAANTFVCRGSHRGAGAEEAGLTATTGKKYPPMCNLSG